MWYTLDGGITNVTYGTNTTFNQCEWDGLLNGTVTITFYANDTAGNNGSASGSILIDIFAPSIAINFPTPGRTFNSTAPRFNVTIIDCNLNDTWYTIDGGATNFTFSSNGTIDQTAWDGQVDGSITLIFYANDTLGNVNSVQVIIVKDTIDPIIIIYTPTDDQLLGPIAPSFSVWSNDTNLDTLWYTIDNGNTNITYGTNTTFNQGEWDGLLNGTVTITFYANDSAGHNGSASVTNIIITKFLHRINYFKFYQKMELNLKRKNELNKY